MKYIFITGGVVSSLGKGLTASSIGTLLELRGLKVCLQKFDPYLNVDPGTLNPFQHGEVYVLDDGTEADLDLGHYERFTHCQLSKVNSLTAGKIYERVLKKERRGDYLGDTVQLIPHVTDEIKQHIRNTNPNVDICITEIGGTVGDIEGLPFLETLRQLATELRREDILFMHVTLVPYLKAAGELKTKPSQQGVAKLREIGIQPDVIVCRTEYDLPESLRQKLSLFCNVPISAIIEAQDVASIYELPLRLHAEKVDQLIVDRLQLTTPTPSITLWQDIVWRLQHTTHQLTIAVVGKYISLNDAYKSVFEALTHAGIAHAVGIQVKKIDAEVLTQNTVTMYLGDVDGIVIPGGFGARGIEGKILAVAYARKQKIPYFGLCLGLQIAVIEFARNVAGLQHANSSEFYLQTPHPVITMMPDQHTLEEKGGSMRLGAYTCRLEPESFAIQAYGKDVIQERHRHRYELNNQYRSILEERGMRMTGINPERGLVEIIELDNHPWFVAVQFHPEFQSKPTQAHPLFAAFVKAGLAFHKARTVN